MTTQPMMQSTHDPRTSSLTSATSAWNTPATSAHLATTKSSSADTPDLRQLIVFWLSEQRVQAGMNINIWDVADDIERLVESLHPANVDDLADPASRSTARSSGAT
jgi:hypothetical protein